MLKVIRDLLAPLSSLFIMLLGNGLYSTLIPLRLDIEHASNALIGYTSSAYYVGSIIGCLQIEAFIARVGHIRAFAIFATLTTISSLLPVMVPYHEAWIMLRGINGFSMAGIYIVIESWLLGASHSRNYSRVFAIYMIVLYGGQSLGQLLLNVSSPNQVIPFCIASILACLAIIPVCLTYQVSPSIEGSSRLSLWKIYQLSPTGSLNCFVAGMMLASIYGLLPVYANQFAGSIKDTSITMLLVILGARSLQYPIGHLSDILERSWVMLLLIVATIVLSGIIIISAALSKMLFWILIFILGGVTFTLYPIGVSYTCDRVGKENVVAVISSLGLAYSLGATAGPILAALFMDQFGNKGLFIYFASLGAALMVFMLWRWQQPPRVKTFEQSEYIALSSTTLTASKLDPRRHEEDD